MKEQGGVVSVCKAHFFPRWPVPELRACTAARVQSQGLTLGSTAVLQGSAPAFPLSLLALLASVLLCSSMEESHRDAPVEVWTPADPST